MWHWLTTEGSVARVDANDATGRWDVNISGKEAKRSTGLTWTGSMLAQHATQWRWLKSHEYQPDVWQKVDNGEKKIEQIRWIASTRIYYKACRYRQRALWNCDIFERKDKKKKKKDKPGEEVVSVSRSFTERLTDASTSLVIKFSWWDGYRQ